MKYIVLEKIYLIWCKSIAININILEDIKYGLNKFDYNKFYELLKYFGLDDKILKKNYNDLSDGEKKKILLIKTFMSDSKIIILDDVTSALDSKSIDKLIKYLKKEKRNRMILITSFDSDFLLSVSDNIIILDDGIIYSDKYFAFSNEILLNKVGMNMPSVLKFRQIVLNKKNIKLIYRDNINDLIKDIYRNV